MGSKDDSHRRIQRLHDQDRQSTHASGKEKRAATVIRFVTFEPNERPEAMLHVDSSPDLSSHLATAAAELEVIMIEYCRKYRVEVGYLLKQFSGLLMWAHHLERVRESLQRKLNHYEAAALEEQTERGKEDAEV